MEAQLIQNDKMAVDRPAGVRRGPRAQQPAHLDRGADRAAARAGAAPDFPREHLRVIHDQAERAGRIVRNLLTFARKGVPEKAAVDLNDVAARTIAAHRLRAAAPRDRARVRAEPRAGRRAGRPLRAAAGAAQPGHQRGAGGERPAARPAAADPGHDRAPRATRPCSGCGTPGRACRRISCPTCSRRSSRPRGPARAPASGSR